MQHNCSTDREEDVFSHIMQALLNPIVLENTHNWLANMSMRVTLQQSIKSRIMCLRGPVFSHPKLCSFLALSTFIDSPLPSTWIYDTVHFRYLRVADLGESAESLPSFPASGG